MDVVVVGVGGVVSLPDAEEECVELACKVTGTRSV